MTCIIGLKKDCEVWMGCDSYSESNYVAFSAVKPKLFSRVVADEKGLETPMLIAGAGTRLFSQSVEHRLHLPVYYHDSPMHYMVCGFSDALRDCLRSAGFLEKSKNGADSMEGTQLMVAFKGELFVVGSDFCIEQDARCYRAIGAGEDAAMGSLHRSMMECPNCGCGWAAVRKIEMALEAAADVSRNVRAPFHIEKL